MDIGQKLKEKRTAAGLSQEALAKHLSVTRQTVSSWENNRSYPDTGSLIKLSDLYSVSLDELLKEDPVMRKHVEESAPLPRRYWNILFEIAILLLPFGSLVTYWGAPWIGLTLRLVGIFMLPPLWVARWKLFGMPKEDMKKSLTGWSLYVISQVLDLLGSTAGIGGNVLAIVGLLMIYGSGVYLERGPRFWLVIALYVGIPIYIIGSSLVSQFSDMGAFSKAQPFGSDYRIVDIQVGETPEHWPLINLDQFGNDLRLDGVNMGEFSYVKPLEEQSSKGIWQLIPKNDPSGMYKLEVSAEDVTTLSYFQDDHLQWRWEIIKIPRVYFELRSDAFNSVSPMDWFLDGTWTGDPDAMNYTTLHGTGVASIQFRDDTVTELKITEEYHRGNQTEIAEYHLQRDKNGVFPFPAELSARYEDEGQYAIYSIKWEGGTFLFRLNFD